MKNFAIIGCGAIAKMHADVIKKLKNATLYGVFDTRRESATRFSQEYGCEVFETVEEMLACDKVDIVSI